MICSNCKTENPDGAVYCKNCGARTDGQKICPRCKQTTPEDGAYCVHCGGLVAPRGRNVKGILALISRICAGAAALFSVIFVFFIGNSLDIGALDAASVPELSAVAGIDIYYYLGKSFAAITGPAGSVMYTGQVLDAAFGFVCSAGILVCTVTFFIVAAVKLLNSFVNGKNSGITGICASAYLAYVCGVALFMACAGASMTASGVTVRLALNGATVAGLVLGGIFILAAVVLDGLSRGAERPVGKCVAVVASNVVTLVLFAVLLVLLASGMAAVGNETLAEYTGFSAYVGVIAQANGAGNPVASAWGYALAPVDLALTVVCLVLIVWHGGRMLDNVRETSGHARMPVYAGGIAIVIGLLRIGCSYILGACISGAGSSAVIGIVPDVSVLLIAVGILLCLGIIAFRKLSAKLEGEKAAEEQPEPAGQDAV